MYVYYYILVRAITWEQQADHDEKTNECYSQGYVFRFVLAYSIIIEVEGYKYSNPTNTISNKNSKYYHSYIILMLQR
jgi:hypothetical protein